MEFNLEKIIRQNILGLKPYKSLREEFEAENLILLEANENPFGEFNRYPNSKSKKLREKLADINHLKSEQIFIGNGSDELIDLLIRTFCEPAKDSILVMEPSFVMYEFYAKVNNVEVEKLTLNENFEINKDHFLEKIKTSKAKILFLCSPNNPTGNSIENIEFFISKFKGIVVVDEAYIEFSKEISTVKLLHKFPNLIVLKTLSKAFGMAGLRIGIGLSSAEIASLINTIKPPYNVSSFSQEKALEILKNNVDFEKNIALLLKEKEILKQNFSKLNIVKKIFPSDANFFLIEFLDAEKTYQYLIKNKILTSLRHPSLENCLRINIGKPDENLKLIETLKKL